MDPNLMHKRKANIIARKDIWGGSTPKEIDQNKEKESQSQSRKAHFETSY